MKVSGCRFGAVPSHCVGLNGHGGGLVAGRISNSFQRYSPQANTQGTNRWQSRSLRASTRLELSPCGRVVFILPQTEGRWSPSSSSSSWSLSAAPAFKRRAPPARLTGKSVPNLWVTGSLVPTEDEAIRIAVQPSSSSGCCYSRVNGAFRTQQNESKQFASALGRAATGRMVDDGMGCRARRVRRNPLVKPRAAAMSASSGSGEEAGIPVMIPEEKERALREQGRRRSVYHPFVDSAIQELSRRRDVSQLPIKEEFKNMVSRDGTANIENIAFASSKIRMFRIASIQTDSSMQILNVAGFAQPTYDLPIFCADFFSVPNRNIIVLDLNPLFNTDANEEYKNRYFSSLMPLANKYVESLPWGDKLTAESVQFFSPLVLWTRAETKDLMKSLYPAFLDYLGAWLKMVDSSLPTEDADAVARNKEAQHRYISWRVTKDPGRPLLTKLCGEQLAERYINEFLFAGQSTLGTKCFLDYFPEYRTEDGSVSNQRSILGKSFEKRPWDRDGRFSPDD